MAWIFWEWPCKFISLSHSSSSMENLEHKEPVAPTRRLKFQYNGSDLYDSFEFRDMTQQLNKAIKGSNASSPAYASHPNSRLYQRQLNRIYKENSKTPRRILGPQQVPDKRACGGGTREQGFVSRLWLKVKGLLRKKAWKWRGGKPTLTSILWRSSCR